MYVCGFRFYFTPLTGVLFAFPSRYWFTIGQLGVFSLGGWSPHVQTKFHVLRPTRFHNVFVFVYGAITLYRHPFQNVPLTPTRLRANSRSLAATKEISVDFFSSGYLDVSVLPVRLTELCIHSVIVAYATGFPHSEIRAYNAFYRLNTAYRRLTRPSSPLTAKASTTYA